MVRHLGLLSFNITKNATTSVFVSKSSDKSCFIIFLCTSYTQMILTANNESGNICWRGMLTNFIKDITALLWPIQSLKVLLLSVRSFLPSSLFLQPSKAPHASQPRTCSRSALHLNASLVCALPVDTSHGVYPSSSLP